MTTVWVVELPALDEYGSSSILAIASSQEAAERRASEESVRVEIYPFELTD